MKFQESVIEIDEENYLSFLKNDVSILNFFSDWQMNCLMAIPVIESLAEEFSNICFGKVNIEEVEEIARRHNVENVPCLIIFRNGHQIDRIDKNISEEILRERISSLIAC